MTEWMILATEKVHVVSRHEATWWSLLSCSPRAPGSRPPPGITMRPALLLSLLLAAATARSAPAADSLLAAAERGDLERVRRLVHETDAPDVNVRDTSDRTPLILAASYGDPEIVQELVTAGAEVDSQDMYGWSPLHWAADTGHAACVHKLLDNGASIDIQDTEGWSALHWAAYRGNMEVVQELTERGAITEQRTRLDRSTGKRYTAWDLASMYGHAEVAHFLHQDRLSAAQR
jgi:ankyrin repeat protein